MPIFTIKSVSTTNAANEQYLRINGSVGRKPRYNNLNAAYQEVDRLEQAQEKDPSTEDSKTVLTYMVQEMEPMSSDLLAHQEHLAGCNYSKANEDGKHYSMRCSCMEIRLNVKEATNKLIGAIKEPIEVEEDELDDLFQDDKKDTDYKLIKYGSEDQAKDDMVDIRLQDIEIELAKESQNVKEAFDEQLSKINSHHGFAEAIRKSKSPSKKSPKNKGTKKKR